jgi:enamine deaminase RidA (YjgF/YER057c/UK114 family)
MATIDKYCAKGIFDPPSYSQGVKVSGAQNILFIAGQVAYDDKGNAAHRGDFAAQARAVFQAVKAQVEAGGGTMQSIVKINTYLTDIRHRAELVPIREEFLGKKGPASTLVAVAALAQPDWLIEVEAIAVV